MRFLADENFPATGVAALRAAGIDVVWVRTALPGASDPDVLAWAVREGRILITFDKDFGELAKVSGLRAECGIILLRIRMSPAADAGRKLASLIMGRDDWAGHFSVIEPGRIRMRPIEE